jgi:putative spermidine/putrescine transport system permease protein
VASCLIVFNLCMGAFTSAALLGAGKVLTLPVLIQRTVIFDTKYGMGAALAGVLLMAGLVINLVSLGLVTRLKSTRGITA